MVYLSHGPEGRRDASLQPEADKAHIRAGVGGTTEGGHICLSSGPATGSAAVRELPGWPLWAEIGPARWGLTTLGRGVEGSCVHGDTVVGCDGAGWGEGRRLPISGGGNRDLGCSLGLEQLWWDFRRVETFQGGAVLSAHST